MCGVSPIVRSESNCAERVQLRGASPIARSKPDCAERVQLHGANPIARSEPNCTERTRLRGVSPIVRSEPNCTERTRAPNAKNRTAVRQTAQPPNSTLNTTQTAAANNITGSGNQRFVVSSHGTENFAQSLTFVKSFTKTAYTHRRHIKIINTLLYSCVV